MWSVDQPRQAAESSEAWVWERCHHSPLQLCRQSVAGDQECVTELHVNVRESEKKHRKLFLVGRFEVS